MRLPSSPADSFTPSRPRLQAFTLIEVAVASAILAIALFAILQICTVCLRGARSLSRVHVDASSLAAELSLTNRLEEGSDSGTFGEAYPGYSWNRTISEYTTKWIKDNAEKYRIKKFVAETK